jgi:galactonate dehydratase
LVQLNSALACVKIPTGLNFGPVALLRLETWITAPEMGGDEWGHVKPCLFVRLTTKDGIYGWGEAFVLPYRKKAVAEIIHALGRSASKLKSISPWAFLDLAKQAAAHHLSLKFSAASSALKMALWDISGKLLNAPLCDLLGGDHNRAIPIHGNIRSATQWGVASFETRATDLVAQEYRSIRIHPMLNHAAQDAAIGDDIALLVDLDAQGNADAAIQIAQAIKPAHAYWFEEPIDGNDSQALAQIRKDTGLRGVTGEKHCGLAHFRAVLAAGAADILNPDIAAVGGILDLLELAELAEQQGVQISPHCSSSMTVAAAAMLHVCASIPNAELAEIYPAYIPYGEKFALKAFHLEGEYAHLSYKPGIGVDLNVSALHTLCEHHQSTCLSLAEATC